MVDSIYQNTELLLALYEAIDPSQTTYTPTIKSALRVVDDVDEQQPKQLIDTALKGLIDCAQNPEETADIRQKLIAGIVAGANRLPLAEDEENAQLWKDWLNRLPAELPVEDRCIVLFNLAGSAFSRLDTPPQEVMIEPVLQLFLSSQKEGAPPRLIAMAHQSIAHVLLTQRPADLKGIYHSQQAALGFKALNEPAEAFKIWRQLMHWLLDLDEYAEAFNAGAEGYQLATQLSPEIYTSFSRELVKVARLSPGEGRYERLQVAIAISRALVQECDNTGSADEQILERINLANALLDLGGGDDVANVEEALSTLLCIQENPLLKQDSRLTKLWLSILALTYKRRTVGNPDDNLEQSIECYSLALSLPIEQSDQVLQNDTQDVVDGTIIYNLANDLLRRRRGNRRSNLVRALRFHQSLRQRRQLQQSHSQLQARSWFSIGNVHYEWARLNTLHNTKHLFKAIRAYRKAEQLLDSTKQPDDMARTIQAGIRALTLLPKNPVRLQIILTRCEQASRLAVSTGNIELQEELAACRGLVLFRSRRMSEAIAAYSEALRLRHQLIAEVVSGVTRTSLLKPMATYAARLAFAMIQSGQVNEGISVLLEARAIDLDAALTGVQSDSRNAKSYRAARALMLKLEAEEAQLKTALSTQTEATLHTLHQQLIEARSSLDTAAAFGPDEASAMATILTAQTNKNVLIAFPIFTSAGAVIVYRTGGQKATVSFQTKFLNSINIEDMRNLLIGDDTTDLTSTGVEGWQTIVADIAAASSSETRQTVTLRMTQFFRRLGESPLSQALRKLITETKATELRLLTHGGLQTLPIALATDPQSAEPLSSQVAFSNQIGIALSTAVTKSAAKDTPHSTKRTRRVLVVADPQENLPFSRWEAALISAAIQSTSTIESPIEIDIIQGKEATRQILLERVGWADILHFAGHAKHQWKQATQSALICADGPLSVQDLRLVTQRAPLQLVVLSACDSGLTDLTQLPDEFVGLPASFFALGAEAVISAMWSVSDEAAAVLMADFYRNIFKKKMPWSQALKAAQRQIASSTACELSLAEQLEYLYVLGNRQEAALIRRALFHKRHPEAKPFVHTIFWGAYTCQVR